VPWADDAKIRSATHPDASQGDADLRRVIQHLLPVRHRDSRRNKGRYEGAGASVEPLVGGCGGLRPFRGMAGVAAIC
jgi:hypothetical protein